MPRAASMVPYPPERSRRPISATSLPCGGEDGQRDEGEQPPARRIKDLAGLWVQLRQIASEHHPGVQAHCFEDRAGQGRGVLGPV